MRILVSFLAFSFLPLIHCISTPIFRDVTSAVGVEIQTRQKWGGPCVADIDNDGYYDIILSFHASAPVQIYWGNPNGTFTKDDFKFQADVHGVNVGYRTARTQQRLLTINVGGGRGNALKPPQMFLINQRRRIRNITNEFGLGKGVGRGRVTLFMDLSLRNTSQRFRDQGGPDLTVLGFVDQDDGILQHGYKNNKGRYALRRLPGFEMERDGRAALLDLDNDGVMELISYPSPQIYKLTAPFTFEDVTATYLAADERSQFLYGGKTLAAVAEFDMNNKGAFDLYLARSLVSDLLPRSNRLFPFFDVLFKNNGKSLLDISTSAGVPNNTRSVGVTSGDFDNNGYVDLFISVFDKPDFFLMNNGNETFTRVDGIIPKDVGVPGDHAVAVDYDQDGRLDLIVGQGTKADLDGPFRIMRNVLLQTNKRHYLLVRVGHHPKRIATALHAVVIVRIGTMRMMRRVGSPGTQGGGPSLLDTVHFGLGEFDVIDFVRVRWIAGGSRIMRNVAANQKITFGIVD